MNIPPHLKNHHSPQQICHIMTYLTLRSLWGYCGHPFFQPLKPRNFSTQLTHCSGFVFLELLHFSTQLVNCAEPPCLGLFPNVGSKRSLGTTAHSHTFKGVGFSEPWKKFFQGVKTVSFVKTHRASSARSVRLALPRSIRFSCRKRVPHNTPLVRHSITPLSGSSGAF